MIFTKLNLVYNRKICVRFWAEMLVFIIINDRISDNFLILTKKHLLCIAFRIQLKYRAIYCEDKLLKI